MGLLASVLRRPNDRQTAGSPSYKTFTEFAPSFSSWGGQCYEQQLVRSAVDRIAVACSKLKPEVQGSAKPRVRRAIETSPNDFMTWPQFHERLATILNVDTTAYVVPSLDEGLNVTGVWPLKAEFAEVVEHAGEPWVRFQLASGDVAAIELRRVAVLTRFQYESDFFGSGNSALDPTMRLLHDQEEAERNAMRSGATVRWIGKVSGSVRPEDVEKKRKAFSERNLDAEVNRTGLMVYDNTWDDVRQVEPTSWVVPADEMERIQAGVYTYFGVNESILTNDYSEEQWGAFYESKVEPYAVQLGEALTRMLYTQNEVRRGNRIMFSANRLEYASNASKRNMIRDMTDRQLMTINEAREVLQLKPVPGGDSFIGRGEYYKVSLDGEVTNVAGGEQQDLPTSQLSDFDLGGGDDEYRDTDARGSDEDDKDEGE